MAAYLYCILRYCPVLIGQLLPSLNLRVLVLQSLVKLHLQVCYTVCQPCHLRPVKEGNGASQRANNASQSANDSGAVHLTEPPTIGYNCRVNKPDTPAPYSARAWLVFCLVMLAVFIFIWPGFPFWQAAWDVLVGGAAH